MNYPNETGYVNHSQTSRDSAEKLDQSGNAKSYDDMILAFLDARALRGATAEEARKEINKEFPHVHNGSINGRMSTLWRRKEIIKTSYKRKTDAKKDAHVYALATYRDQFAAEGTLEPDYSQVKPQAGLPKEVVDQIKINLGTIATLQTKCSDPAQEQRKQIEYMKSIAQSALNLLKEHE